MTLPVPFYQIGQRVWFAGTTEGHETLKCPDCLGTGKWKVITPAGLEMRTHCTRCYGRDLSFQTVAPRTESFVIGRIRTDSGAAGRSTNSWGDERVQYQPENGNCSLYNESRLHTTEEGATAAATLLAAERQAELEKSADYKNRRKDWVDMSTHNLEMALVKERDDKISKLEHTISYVIESLLDLSEDNYPYAGDTQPDSPLGVYESRYDAKLTEFQARAIQDTVARRTYDKDFINRLVRQREEKENCTC